MKRIVITIFVFTNYFVNNAQELTSLSRGSAYVDNKKFMPIVLEGNRTVIFEENFEGDNTPAGLAARGWSWVNVDGGGTTQSLNGDTSKFPAFEGVGYIAQEYHGANGFYIDQWLISPSITCGVGDTISFWYRSKGRQYPDSVVVKFSPTGGSDPADFTIDWGNSLVPATWTRRTFVVPTGGSVRFAIQYLMYDGGPSGASSDYWGLDLFQVTSASNGGGDGNDNPTTATQILSLPHTGYYDINPDLDVDWYRVNLTAGQPYTLTNTSSTNFDSKFWLFGPGNPGGTDIGTLVANDDDGGGNMQPLINYIPTISGYYYLRVAYYSNNPTPNSMIDGLKTESIVSTGPYTLNISLGNSSPANLVAGSNFKNLITLIWEAPSLTMRDLDNYPHISSNKNVKIEKVRLTIDYFNVYRKEGSSGTYSLLGTTTRIDYIDNSVTLGSTYYYKVSAVINGVEGSLSNEASASCNITGFTFNLPNSIVSPVIDGIINNGEWSDAYSMNIKNILGVYNDPPTEDVFAYIKIVGNHFYLAIKDFADNTNSVNDQIGFYFDNNNNNLWDVGEGNFWLQRYSPILIQFREITGTYPDALQFGTASSNPVGVTGAIEMNGGHTEYEISFDMTTSPFHPSGNSFGLFIFSADLENSPSAFFSSRYPNAAVWTAPVSYADVYISGTNILYETEPNDTASQANLIIIGDTIDAAIDPSGDVDYFKFDANAGDTLEIYLNNRSNSQLDAAIWLYDISGNLLEYNDDYLSTSQSRIVWNFQSSGEYYIRIAYYQNWGTFPNQPSEKYDLNRNKKLETSLLADIGPYRLRLSKFIPTAPIAQFVYTYNTYYNSTFFRGLVWPNGLNTIVTIEFGLTTSYSNSISAIQNPLNGYHSIYVNTPLVGGLLANTQYNFRIKAENSLGTSYSPNYVFITPQVPDGWIIQNSGTTYVLYGVSFTDANNGTAVGDYGTILRTTNGGANWVQQNSGTTYWLYGVSFTDANNGTAIGGYGTILRTTNGGANWVQQNSGTTYWLLGVSFTDANNGTAVGEYGTILRTTNGGANWVQQNSGTTNFLTGVSFINAALGTVVGEIGAIIRSVPPAPYVQILAPNGGENWHVSAIKNITWNSYEVTNIKLEYTSNNGTSWIEIIGSTAASSGVYSWTIPNTPSSQCLVRIANAANVTMYDMSDDLFTIYLPPVITVTPDSFYVTIAAGDSIAKTMTIGNTGQGVLNWNVAGYQTMKNFNLISNAYSIITEGNELKRQQSSDRGTVMSFLSDLTGKRIGLSLIDTIGYQNFISDLRARGCEITFLTYPINSAILDPLHVVVIDDRIVFATTSDLNLIRNWLTLNSKALMLMADNSGSISQINYLLDGTGISETFIGTFAQTYTTNILAHPITLNVDTLSSQYNGYGSYCTTITPAHVIAYDEQNRPHVVISNLGLSKVLVMCNEYAWQMPDTSHGDNRTFTNQSIDWLVGSNFVSVIPNSGTVQPGQSQNVIVNLTAKELDEGEHRSTIRIENNEPDNTPKSIHVTLRVVPNSPFTWLTSIALTSGFDNVDLTFGQAPSANNGIDALLDELELPPVPPTGVFDGRFELPVSPPIASIKDFRNDSLTAIEWILKFQPGSAGYPINFNWNSSSLPAGTFFLKDVVTGTIVNINMKTQNNYSLTNTGIVSLKIEYKQQICKDVELTGNWNMVSVPLIASDMTKMGLFPSAASLAYGYNNGYVQASTLETSKGYWLKFDSAQTVNICGNQVSATTVGVMNGWNIVGVYDKDILVSGITSTPNGIISSTFYGYNNGYSIASTLYSGKGYWVKVSQNGTLNLPSQFVKSIEIGTQSDWFEKAGKIIISDANGNTTTLYITKEQLDLSRFELPPLPPTGIYDVRFSSDRLVELIDQQKKLISINSADYPITVRVEGVSCIISDEIGGNLLKKTVHDGEEIEIRNSKLTKLGLILTDAKPLTYQLYQNYPNPFNPNTVIRYQLSEASLVILKVYDVLGSEVTILVNEFQNAGNYEINFEASKLSSGVYIFKLNAGNYSNLKKMTIMK